jgi:hypothetical protein
VKEIIAKLRRSAGIDGNRQKRSAHRNSGTTARSSRINLADVAGLFLLAHDPHDLR